jgi:hypothetical protein
MEENCRESQDSTRVVALTKKKKHKKGRRRRRRRVEAEEGLV